jgi:hypothetical protein
MKKSFFAGAMAGCLAWTSVASAVENPIFSYTHLLPSPFTLPAGRVALGTDVAIGITDFLQVGTNLLGNFAQIYNANAKVSLLDFPDFAAGLNLGWQSYNAHDLDPNDPSVQVTSWLPGAVAGVAIIPMLAVFGGINFNISSVDAGASTSTTSGYLRGTRLESDIAWAYNPHKKSIGNVVAAGVSYDTTYDLFGVGLSHYWKGFHVGLHYYPGADRNKFLPILAGGAVVDL